MSQAVMPTRILIVGGGGREHALAWKLAAEPGVNLVVVAPGSDAIAAEPRVRCAPEVAALDGTALVDLARREAIELAVVGPEAPLEAGVADALRAAGVATFGPSRAAARIETSKAFCRGVAEAAGVRMARGAAFASFAAGQAFAAELARSGGGVVVKADGLAAGKGVTVCDELDDAIAALGAIFGEDAIAGTADSADSRPRVVIEERLIGREASVIALCDGATAVALPAARDHKRLLDGDGGPNTGGMGAYSPLPDLSPDEVRAIVERIHRPILRELARRGSPFVGALYAGLMLTRDGAVLLECNARFGDPETQVLMPRLGGALGPWLLAAARGALGIGASGGSGTPAIPVIPGAMVGIVLAAAGYPARPRAGDPIAGLDDVRRAGLVFGSAIARDEGGTERTAGGRVLTVVGRGPDLAGARAAAEGLAEMVRFDGLQRRRDIGIDLPPASTPPPAPASASEPGSSAPSSAETSAAPVAAGAAS
jgi:phosphoribosylamine--glycine ligase